MLTPRPDGLTDWIRIERQNTRGQGFDDVIVELRGQPPKAKIRIIEVKDYPNRTVPREHMTAIGDNLSQKMKSLRKEIDAAVRATTAAQRPSAYQKLSPEQMTALGNAVNQHDFQIELRLGAQTSMGPSPGRVPCSASCALTSRARASSAARTCSRPTLPKQSIRSTWRHHDLG